MNHASTNSKSKRRKTPGKKLPPQQEHIAPDEELYEIRDILREKLQGGRLWYLIDWAGDDSSGKPYKPTWEPAENATPAAVADWEDKKRRRQITRRISQRSSVTLSSESDSQPVQPSNSRKRKQRTIEPAPVDIKASKKPRTAGNHSGASSRGEPTDPDWAIAGPVPPSQQQLVLEIKREPGFDPRDYIPFNLSQLSQGSQDIPLPSFTSSQAAPSQTQPSGGISQATIPDSQEITDSSSSQFPANLQLREVSPLVHATVDSDLASIPDQVDTNRTHPGPVSSEGTGLDIPSRQPDSSVHRASNQSTHLFADQRDTSGTLEPNASSGGFLTQPEFNLNLESLLPQAEGVGPNTATLPRQIESEAGGSDEQSTGPPPPVSLDSQPAQVVVPLSSFQTQDDIIDSIESDIVPDTVLKAIKREPIAKRANHSSDVPPSTSIVEGDVRPRPESRISSSKTSIRNLTAPSAPKMDPFPPNKSPASSIVERLRELRAAALDRTDFTSPRTTTTTSLPPGVAQPMEQSIISPSSVLPVTDNDEPQGSPKGQVNPSDMWHATTATGLGLGTLDMPFPTRPAQEPSSQNPLLSAPEGIQDDINVNFGLKNSIPSIHMPTDDFSREHEQTAEFAQIPATVAPSDLTNASANLFALTADALHGQHDHLLGEDAGDHVENLLSGAESDHYHPDADLEEGPEAEYIVTLPMAANTRPEYLRRISGENKKIMCDFGRGFADSLDWVPDDTLLAKMDHIFRQLLDLCDLPAFVDDMDKLDSRGLWKHATNTNSKFSFVYELLNKIRDLNIRVMILCRSGFTFQYLEALLSAPGFNYSILGHESEKEEVDGLAVILAAADQNLSAVDAEVDVIINFDHVARNTDLSHLISNTVAPVVLSLVIAYSIEHIDLKLGLVAEGIERKNVINLAIGIARKPLMTPERIPHPHEIAETFSSFLRSRDPDFEWEPQALPGEIFDVWMSSQAATQDQLLTAQYGMVHASNNRKRPLDDDDLGTPKRARIVDPTQPTRNTTPARMSDLLKSTLAKFSARKSSPVPSAEVPVYQLEAMAAKLAEQEELLASRTELVLKYEKQLKSLDSELKGYKRSVQTIQPKYMEALRDRGISEKKSQKAVEEAAAATSIKERLEKSLEESKREIADLKEKNRTQDKKLVDLVNSFASSTTPDVARLATAEKTALEAKAKVESLEKKLASSESDHEYTRSQYQRTGSDIRRLVLENSDLTRQKAEAEKLASANLVKIHEINSRNEAESWQREIDEKNEMIRDLQRDIDRKNEELRHLKNGRRETRQVSVPRSPRPGSTISPRTRGISGPAPGSRGTSPAHSAGVFNGETAASAASNTAAAGGASGSAFFGQPTGTNRWDHLRD